MLRIYESRGLLTPARTDGGTRRYSEHDIERIERITMYLDEGLNLAGIERVFVLEAETDQLRDQVRDLGGRPRRPR
jgi:DNA-binding transcriptional MerR regulator